MPEYQHPGVYIEEIERGPRPIEGVPTNTAAFVGETERGPRAPQLVTSYTEYQRVFGGVFHASKYLPRDAYFVKCDRTTMTQDDIESGRLICEVGVAPVRAAEFVIFRIFQRTAAFPGSATSNPRIGTDGPRLSAGQTKNNQKRT